MGLRIPALFVENLKIFTEFRRGGLGGIELIINQLKL